MTIILSFILLLFFNAYQIPHHVLKISGFTAYESWEIRDFPNIYLIDTSNVSFQPQQDMIFADVHIVQITSTSHNHWHTLCILIVSFFIVFHNWINHMNNISFTLKNCSQISINTSIFSNVYTSIVQITSKSH